LARFSSTCLLIRRGIPDSSVGRCTYRSVVKFDGAATALSHDAEDTDRDAERRERASMGTPRADRAGTGRRPLLGGYGSTNDQGVTFTIAAVGTNMGPYLLARSAPAATTEPVHRTTHCRRSRLSPGPSADPPRQDRGRPIGGHHDQISLTRLTQSFGCNSVCSN
jgi:hypothetical protein